MRTGLDSSLTQRSTSSFPFDNVHICYLLPFCLALSSMSFVMLTHLWEVQRYPLQQGVPGHRCHSGTPFFIPAFGGYLAWTLYVVGKCFPVIRFSIRSSSAGHCFSCLVLDGLCRHLRRTVLDGLKSRCCCVVLEVSVGRCFLYGCHHLNKSFCAATAFILELPCGLP